MYTINIDPKTRELVLENVTAEELQKILTLLADWKTLKVTSRSKSEIKSEIKSETNSDPYLTFECSGTHYSKNKEYDYKVEI